MDESAKAQAMVAGYRFAVATNSGPRAMHQDPFGSAALPFSRVPMFLACGAKSGVTMCSGNLD
jgi:hypothetical protein